MVVTQARMQANSTTGRGETGTVGGNATNKLKRITASEQAEGAAGGTAASKPFFKYEKSMKKHPGKVEIYGRIGLN